MEDQRILGIIGVHYPYALSESFFHEELIVLSRSFSKIVVFLTDVDLIHDKKVLYEVPKNVELVELNTKISFTDNLFSLMKTRPLTVLKELQNRNKKFSWSDKWKAIKTTLYYESRSRVFVRSLKEKLIKRSLSSENIILYSYWLNEFSYGLTKLKLTNPDFRICSRAHGWDVYEERHRPPYLPFRKTIISNLDGLFTISEQGKKYLVNNFKISKNDNLHTALLGTPPSKVNSYTFQKERLEILTIAFLSPVKNIELLIEALAGINHPFRWTHIGDDDSEYSMRIKTLAKSKITKAHFQFLGKKTNKEIRNYLASASIDFLINTSVSEGIPVSMMEAISCGIPVIAPNIGGISELIDEKSGFLLSEKPNAEEIKTCIDKFCTLQTETIEDMKLAAHAIWESKFNSEVNYMEFAKQLKGKKR